MEAGKLVIVDLGFPLLLVMTLPDFHALTPIQFDIEMDVRGSIVVVGQHVEIDQGEIRSSSSGVSEGISQLAARLKLAEFLAVHLNNLEDDAGTSVIRIGRMFIPKGEKAIEKEYLDKQRDDSFALYFHHL